MISITVVTLVVWHLTFITTFMVLGSLSRIFGMAKKKKPVYRFYYVSCALLAVSLVFNLAGMELDIPYLGEFALALNLTALAAGFGVTMYYWEWLPRELRKG